MGARVSGAGQAHNRANGRRDRVSSAGLAAALALGVTLALAVGCTSALAAVGHPFLTRLTLPGASPRPAAVAVDSASGAVFVADDAQGVVDVYSPSGSYLTQFGAGILEDNAGSTQVVGIALDGAGRVYVADKQPIAGGSGGSVSAYAGTVYIFRPDGFGGYVLLSEWRGPSTPFGSLQGVAVDQSKNVAGSATGNVYVDDGSPAAVYVLQPPPVGAEEAKEGTLVSTLAGKPKFTDNENVQQANGVAVDGMSGAVYVGDEAKRLVEVFDGAGELQRVITGKSTPTRRFGKIEGLAVEDSSGDLYVAGEEAVDEFNPAGEAVGRTLLAGTSTPLRPLGVAADNSSGASRGQLYVIDGASASVQVYGASVPVPIATTGNVGSVERALGSGAITGVLSATVDSGGEAAGYRFEYRELGSKTFLSTPRQPVGAATATEVHATVELAPEAFYEFRVVAEDDAHIGTGAYGLPVVFRAPTPPAVSALATGAATVSTPSEATLAGSLKADSIETAYHFEFGETKGYGKSTAPLLTSAKGVVAAQAPISGLTAGGTYHFRIVASNEFGTTYGLDATFMTPAAGAPDILSESGELTASGGLTLNAEIDPEGEAASYRFEYGATQSYGQGTSEASLPVGGAAASEVTGLAPATTYHFRVIAKSRAGETVGADATVATPGQPAAAAAALPDGRAYEMVSPPDKHGGYIEPLAAGGSPIQASEDGNALAYVDLGSVVEGAEGNGSPEAQQVLATRGPTSWSSQEIVTPTERVRGSHLSIGTEYFAFSTDLSLALLQPLPDSGSPLAEPPLTPPLSEAERGHQEKTIYLRADAPLAPSMAESQILRRSAPQRRSARNRTRRGGEQARLRRRGDRREHAPGGNARRRPTSRRRRSR